MNLGRSIGDALNIGASDRFGGLTRDTTDVVNHYVLRERLVHLQRALRVGAANISFNRRRAMEIEVFKSPGMAAVES